MMVDPSILSVYTSAIENGYNGAGSGGKGRPSEEEAMRAAREFEALFIYELLKGMHSMGGGGLFGEGFSGEVFQTLFETELSRSLAQRGTGLTEMIMKALEDGVD